MEVTEYDRHQLFVWFEERMGPERAATMMNLIPPIGWFELASKHDLLELEGRLINATDAKLSSRSSSRTSCVASSPGSSPARPPSSPS